MILSDMNTLSFGLITPRVIRIGLNNFVFHINIGIGEAYIVSSVGAWQWHTKTHWRD